MATNFANLQAAQIALEGAQQAAQQAYLSGLLQHQNDQLAFDQAKEAFQQTIAQSGLTGMFNGQPTLQSGELLGQFNGQPTLAAQQALGVVNGQPTLSQGALTGFFNGQPTLANVTSQNQLATNFLNILAQLQGPANAFQYAKVLNATPGGLRDIVNAAAGRFRMPGAGAGAMPTPANMQGADLNTLVNAVTGGTGTVGGQPAAGTTPGTGAGSVSGSPLVQGAGATGAPRFNAPGPTSPNDTLRGTLMPGTTGMFQGAQQNRGIGPGQGSYTYSGTRGTNITGFDPTTGQVQFQSQFLQPKSRVVYNLFDQTTGQNLIDNSAVQGAQKGTGTGWGGAYYVPGGNGTYLMNGGPGVTDYIRSNPTHSFRIRIALPDEGGGAGDAMEQDVPGAAILGLPNHNAQQQQQQQAAAQPVTAPAATTAQSSPATIPDFGALPQPNQLDPLNYLLMSPSQKSLLLGAYSFMGWNPQDVESAVKSGLPQYAAPGTAVAKMG